MTKEEIGLEIANIQEVLDKQEFPLALSHNDLIPANIIFNDETGKLTRTATIYIVLVMAITN